MLKHLLTMFAVMAALYLYPPLTNAQETELSPQELLALTYAGPELDKNIEKARTLKHELEETVALAEKLRDILDGISVPSTSSLASTSSEDLLDTLKKSIDPDSVKCTNPLCRCDSCTCNNCGCEHIASTSSSTRQVQSTGQRQVLLNGKPIDLNRYLSVYGNGPTVGVRGMTIDAHLGHHGFSNFSHLSNSEKFRLHTAAHNAGVPASIRTTMTSVSTTPTTTRTVSRSSSGASYGNCANGRCANTRRNWFPRLGR